MKKTLVPRDIFDLWDFNKIISTHLLTVRSGFRLVSLCAVSARFTGLAAYSIIYPGSSKFVILKRNGVVNGVVGTDKLMEIIKTGKILGILFLSSCV